MQSIRKTFYVAHVYEARRKKDVKEVNRVVFIMLDDQDKVEDWPEDWLTGRKRRFIYAQLRPD